jgi:hypothetical protein
MGALTVELVAIHAAMADANRIYARFNCCPQALLDPKANWRGIQTTTATSAVLVIVNGPIIYEIGLASRQRRQVPDIMPMPLSVTPSI